MVNLEELTKEETKPLTVEELSEKVKGLESELKSLRNIVMEMRAYTPQPAVCTKPKPIPKRWSLK